MVIKICGLRSIQDIEIINRYPIDYAGFIFAPSKRQITLEKAKELRKLLNPKMISVGVFVNEPIEKIALCVQNKVIGMIQLHGDEDERYIYKLKEVIQVPIIKAFRIKDYESIKKQKYLIESPLIDTILLDTWHKASYGGTGETFNWQLLHYINRPYILSGGIDSTNIEKALSYKPYGVDSCSKVETNGQKDEQKVKQLVDSIRQYESKL